MKKTDIAMIILIASVSVLIAFFVANSLPFFKDSSKPVTIKTADRITDTIIEPDASVFNKQAINPTVEVIIGNNSQTQTPATPATKQ
ncbi:MAG: hypothetical protein ABJA64_00125 [Candidatus Saccharibacteria bacterium]